jgi:hypothetical protein
MKENRLLVVPMIMPGSELVSEIVRAINFQLYEILGDRITFLDFDEEFELYKHIVGNPDFIKDCNWFCHGYKELKQRHLEILSCVDNVLIYGIPTYCGVDAGYYRGLPKPYKLDTINLELDKCHRKDDYGFVNYGTRVKLKNVLSRMVFFESLGEADVNVFHYQLDPREVNLSPLIGNNRYHILRGLKSTVGPSRPIPFFEWGLKNTYVQELSKERDFYFGMNCGFINRYRYRDVVDKFNNCINRKIPNKEGFSNKLSGYAYVSRNSYKAKVGKVKDASISQSEYYYKLYTSRYTFVNVPYLETEFNYQRFMEAIILGCIPFIDNKMNLDDLRLTYHEFYDIIMKEKLVIDTDADSYIDIAKRMKRYSENGDSELISKFKNTKAYQALMDENKIKECWRKKLGWKDV